MTSGKTDLPDSAPLALIVEDDEHAARIAHGMLGMLGYRSRHAADATQALYALSEGPPSLILLDICLPEMDGIGLMKIARRVQNMDSVPVVAASAVYPTNGPVLKMLAEAGVDIFLSKPFMLEELRRAIDQARSLALKHGPPPAVTMSDGKLTAVTDEDVAAAEAAVRVEPAKPPARAAPSPPRPAAPSPAPPTLRPVITDRLTDSAEFNKPSPWQSTPPTPAKHPDRITDTAEWRQGAAWGEPKPARPAPTSVDSSVLVNEVVARGLLGSSPLELVIDDCTHERMKLRSTDTAIEVGATLKLEIDHRVPVQDSMTDVRIRALVHVTESQLFGRGSILRAKVAAARPPEHFTALVVYFAIR